MLALLEIQAPLINEHKQNKNIKSALVRTMNGYFTGV